MPAKNPPPKDEKPQKQRFIDTAREHGADETGRKFDKAIEKILPAKSLPKG
jgi:hypothetical protein